MQRIFYYVFPTTISCLVLGFIAGFLWPEHAPAMGDIGTYVIRLIKAFAVPLLFLAIVDAMIKSEFTGITCYR